MTSSAHQAFVLVNCRKCGTWAKVQNGTESASCAKCGNITALPDRATIEGCPESVYSSTLTERNLQERKGFRFCCPHCQKNFHMASSVESQVVICNACDTPFTARSYHDKLEGNAQIPSASVSPSVAVPEKPKKCAACHAPILEQEEFFLCPECSLPYHCTCWEENMGCAAYGCSQVECLKPKGPAFTISAAEAGTSLPYASLAPAPENLAFAESLELPWPAMLAGTLALNAIFLFLALSFQLSFFAGLIIPLLLFVYCVSNRLQNQDVYRNDVLLKVVKIVLRVIFWGPIFSGVFVMHISLSGGGVWSAISGIPALIVGIYLVARYYWKNKEVSS